MPAWPIPPDFPLHELVGQEVTQVCIGLAQVHVQLFRQPQSGTPDTKKFGARIDVEAAFTLDNVSSGRIRVDPQSFLFDEAQLANGGLLTRLLGRTVVEVVRESGNELRLAFSGGVSLLLHTDPQGFESFHLSVGGESATVTSA